MIKKTEIGGYKGLLYLGENNQGFFIFRSSGSFKGGSSFDKVVIAGAFMTKRGERLSTKNLGDNDIKRRKTISSSSIDMTDLPELIQALTMLAMDTGYNVAKTGMGTVVEHKEIDEVEEFIQAHKGRVET